MGQINIDTYDDFSQKTILIAGAAGFVPGHVAEFYLERGAKVVGVDNFITGTRKTAEILSRFKNFEFFEHDLSKGVPEGAKSFSFDYIYSLASPASPIDFKKIPLEIMAINSEGTRHLLELAKENNARFLEASTSEVYGDPEIHPQKESYWGNVNPVGPRSCYDEAKRFAEAITMAYHRHHGVDTRIIRIFNTYGPRMRPDDGRVIPNFVNQALDDKSLTVYGDGSQTRSFCYVSDLVRAIATVMEIEDHYPFNIGNPEEYSIKETAEIVLESLKGQTNSEIAYEKLPQDDPMRRKPDLSRIQQFSAYKPKVSFQEGLKRTVDYFRSLKLN